MYAERIVGNAMPFHRIGCRRPPWLGRWSAAYQDQFCGFKSHRVHINARRDFFLHEEIDSINSGKGREHELATFDESRRAMGMLILMRDKKYRNVPGGRRDDTCDHGLLRRSPRVKPPTS